MAITIVQQSGIPGSGSVPPKSITFSATTTAGNALLVIGLMYHDSNVSPDLISITDDSSGGANTYTYSTTSGNQNPPYVNITKAGLGVEFISLFAGWCLNAAPCDNIVVNFSAAGSFIRIATAELSGVGSVDSAASASAPGGSVPPYRTTLALTDSGDFVAMSADDFVEAILAPAGSSTFTGSGSSPAVSWIEPGVTGSYNVDFSTANPGTSDYWATVSVAFKPPGAGPSGPNLLMASFP